MLGRRKLEEIAIFTVNVFKMEFDTFSQFDFQSLKIFFSPEGGTKSTKQHSLLVRMRVSAFGCPAYQLCDLEQIIYSWR